VNGRLGIFVLAVSLAAVQNAGAEIAVMSSGKILYIDRYHREDELITLFLTGGGEVTVSSELVANIVPNEIAPEPELAALPLLPHLAPLIEPAAEKYDLDSRLVAAVIWVESSGDPNAVSRTGAKGLMQLMPETARSLGVADVLDPTENVEAGARYLRQQLDDHRDLSLALAAYNAGPSAVARHGGIPPYRETKKYVRRVLELYRKAGGDPDEAPGER
jgi:soluble lytic murein transglycosylase-like protein